MSPSATLHDPASRLASSATRPGEAALQAAVDAHPTTAALRGDPQVIVSRSVCAKPSPFNRLMLEDTGVPPVVFSNSATGEISAFYLLGNSLTGHPGMLHGGAAASLIDEAMGQACVYRLPKKKFAVTATLKMTYIAPVKAGATGDVSGQGTGWDICVVKTEVESVEGRMANVVGWMEDARPGALSKRLVEGKGLFIEPRGV